MSNELEYVEVKRPDFSDAYIKDIFFVTINCGKVLLESGAETYRIEDTMTRIASSYGIESAEVFVTPTVIVFSINDYALTQTVRIKERVNNFEKVVNINTLSREISKGLSIEEARKQIEEIHQTPIFPLGLNVLFGGIIAFMFLLIFNGSLIDALAAFLAGGMGVFTMEMILRYTRIKFFTEFFAAFVIAMISFLYTSFGPGEMMDTIIISGVMPLVPGVLITNALREILHGHLMAGAIKGIEACLTALAIGSGVGLMLILF